MSIVTIGESLFPVKEIPAIQYPNPSDELNQEKYKSTGYKFIVREDTGAVLSCMTNEYKMVKNEEIISKTEAVLKTTKAELKEVKIFGNGARTKWTYRFPNQKVKVAKDDYVNPEIIINNSYDGSTTVGIMGGAFRLVCENGLIIGYMLGRTRNIHSIYNNSLDKIEEFIADTVQKVTTTFDEKFPILVETKLKSEHIVDIIKLVPTQAMEPLTQYLMAHKPKTYWDLLNAATWVATHHLNRDMESTHKMESMIYPNISKWAQQTAQA
jgi:hypothetical protein